MHEIVSGLIGLAVTLLGALVVSVWRFSALATTMSATVDNLKEDLLEVRRVLDDLKSVPVLSQKVQQLEDAVRKLSSVWPKQESRLAVLEQRANSTDKFRAASLSRPEFDPDER